MISEGAKSRARREFQANVPAPTIETDHGDDQPRSRSKPTETLEEPVTASLRAAKQRVKAGTNRPTQYRSQKESRDDQDQVATLRDPDPENIQSRKRERRKNNHEARRRRGVQDTATKIVNDAVRGASTRPAKRSRRFQRGRSPEQIEDASITPTETRMMELCRNTRGGKISAREQKLQEMERKTLQKKKRLELYDFMHPTVSDRTRSDEPESNIAACQKGGRQSKPMPTRDTEVINGQIVFAQGSNQIDRRDNADEDREVGREESIDEDELSQRITSGKWLRRDRSGGWNEILLDRFYQGLRMFGTDFEMISRMFPGKTRRSIKLKFCREEKLDYPRIKAALLGEAVPVVLEEYEDISGKKYTHTDDFTKVLEDDRRRLEEEQAIEKEAMEEAAREREAQAAAERSAAEKAAADEQYTTKQKKFRRAAKKQRDPHTKKPANSTRPADTVGG